MDKTVVTCTGGGFPSIGTGYQVVITAGIRPNQSCSNCFAKNLDTGNLEEPKYKCSTSFYKSCGYSDNPQPCSFFPGSHACTGAPMCLREGYDPNSADCLRWDSPQETVCLEACLEREDPYELLCTGSFIGGKCQPPGGGCSPRPRGGGDKTKEKATDRSAC